MPKRVKPLATIVLLAQRPKSALRAQLLDNGYEVLETFTTDHAVAVCVNNSVDAVVCDHDYFVETGGWSVARSIKSVRARMCVILAIRGRLLGNQLLQGVDAAVSGDDLSEVVATLKRLLPFA